MQHIVLTANSSIPEAAAVQVSYDYPGPQSWRVVSLQRGLGLAKMKGKAVVTVSRQPAAADSKGKRRRSGKSGAETLCTVEVEFERVIPLRHAHGQQQQQHEQGSGYWRPFASGFEQWMGCVALNKFTGTVLGCTPADQPLPVILVDDGATMRYVWSAKLC